jgi:mannitol-1-phosphate 5-dehydrogenase
LALEGNRTYVGFGFGPIQAGLFLYEAFRSGGFRRLVVDEVLPQAVEAVRKAEGHFSLNIAHPERIEIAEIGPVEIENPASEFDRRRLVEAVGVAEEIGTALPSVQHYVSPGPGSIHRILAEGLRRKPADGGPRAVIYAAENHNQAAEILEASVLGEIPEGEREAVRRRVRFLNTVIGKMSGIVSDPEEVRSQGLATIAPQEERAFLVELFKRILISRIRFDDRSAEPPFQRGIGVFEEKDDLLPFEEAKLYGHNATHALAAYVGAVRGVARIADLARLPDVLAFLRAAFIQESGEALIRRHGGLDPLFTPQGYEQYADDLLARMINPYLRDTVERVGRDPERKLGWGDRLVGTMRVALQARLRPARYAFGVAAALAVWERTRPEVGGSTAEFLGQLWSRSSPDEQEKQAVLRLIDDARCRLKRWRECGFAHLEESFQNDNSKPVILSPSP